MADTPSSDNNNKSDGTPAPEVLKPQHDHTSETVPDSKDESHANPVRHLRRGTYRPSHKATFLGLAVVVAILAVNVGGIAFVLKGQSSSKTKVNNDQVTVSQAALDNLGVNRDSVGDKGVLLTVGPAAKFNNNVTVGGDISVSGQLILNNKFSASSASLAQLEAGNTSLQQLNVNGPTSLSTLALRNDLQVAGASHFQGPVTMSQLLTVNNNLNVAGSVSIGGALTVNTFHTSSLVVDNSLTVGGHILTRGLVPSISRGSALSGADTVSMSGNDASGTIQVNIGGGSRTGTVANVAFRRNYSNMPHVVVSPVGAVSNYYVTRTVGGFSIYVVGQSSSVAFDYIVEE